MSFVLFAASFLLLQAASVGEGARPPLPTDPSAPGASQLSETPTSVTLPTGLLDAGTERRLNALALEAMDLVYSGRPVEAGVVVDSLVELAPEDPRPYLVKARYLREYVSEQDNKRERVKPQVAPIHVELDSALAKVEPLLDADENSLPGRLYRGWALMFKAQLHELAYEHWSAGQAAKDGKGDLDRVLEMDPGNPDALMVVGTYLYFADLLPSAIKFATWLLRIPHGDLERGLDYLELAEEQRSWSQHDARALRGAILFGFEGRLEEARDHFDAFDADFPDNPRLIEPVAIIDLFLPDRLGPDLPRIRRVVEANEGAQDRLTRELTARLRLYLAYMELMSGRVDEALANLELLSRENPRNPDWFEPSILVYLSDLRLMLGDTEGARAVVAGREENEQTREFVEWMRESAGPAPPELVQLLHDAQPAARAIYEGRLLDAEFMLTELSWPEPCFLDFYRGEVAFLDGRLRAALPHYSRLVSAENPLPGRLFRRIARLRIAEIYAEIGDRESARETIGEGIDHYDVKDLIRHVAKGRQRHWERLDAQSPES
jgi:tetratricopeptide (TPR) repeat protein